MQLAGKDSEGWAGAYGTYVDGLSITIAALRPPSMPPSPPTPPLSPLAQIALLSDPLAESTWTVTSGSGIAWSWGGTAGILFSHQESCIETSVALSDHVSTAALDATEPPPIAVTMSCLVIEDACGESPPPPRNHHIVDRPA